jgi:poly(3-hydroxybutyrate) depolymerase
MARRWHRWASASLVLSVLSGSGAARALEPVDDFGPDPGELDLFVHRPAPSDAGAALVVALHGCTQTAADFDEETGLVALAEEVPFVLLLPQQRAANNELRCFNFFAAADNRPDAGESGSIRSMVAHAVDTYAVDPAQIFVLGLSAGGSMSAVLVANYPELFAGGAVVAGTPVGCNRPTLWTGGVWWSLRLFVSEAAAASWACGIRGPSIDDRSPDDWGAAVREVAGTMPDRWPPISLWQGGGDTVVDPAAQRELLEQWTNVHGVDAVADAREADGATVRQVYADASGRPVVETWWLDGFPHALPVDPEACGVADTYTVPAEVCAVRRIAAFWGLLP